ncbi:hypothetical protein [Streptomyces sp. NPDC127036]|uniref:hypothetical protein n=1 Tax=Streptomyces sp. NPDC127036 TaxID=3347112 RepID=UPI00364D10D7
MTSPLDPDQPCDPAAASVALAAEAAVFEARSRMLQEAIDAVDARIKAASDTLDRLRKAASARTGEDDDQLEAPDGQDALALSDLDEWTCNSTPCRS